MSRTLARLGDVALYGQLRASGYRSRHIQTGLGPVHVMEARGRGPRPPVMLLHGLGSQSTDWGPIFLRRLRKAVRRVILVDLPGHGRSTLHLDGPMSAIFAHAGELMRAVDEPVVVIGNSLGGMTAVRAVRDADCLGLVLLSPGGAPMSRREMDDIFDPFANPSYRRTLAFLDHAFNGKVFGRRVMARSLHGRITKSSLSSIVSRATLDDLLRPDELQCIAAPTLLVWGGKDHLLPRNGCAFFEAHLPRVECLEPAHLGHAPHVDDPRWVADAIVSFMDRIP